MKNGTRQSQPTSAGTAKGTFGSLLGYASGALGTLALFRAFGPLDDLSTWMMNVVAAYDGLTRPIRDALASLGILLTDTEFNANLAGIFLIGLCTRTILSLSRSEARAFAMLIIWATGISISILLTVYVIIFGISSLFVSTIDVLPAIDIIKSLFRYIALCIGLFIFSGVFALVLSEEMGHGNQLEMFDEAAAKSDNRLLYHLSLQIFVSTVFMGFLFIFGTTAFFDF